MRLRNEKWDKMREIPNKKNETGREYTALGAIKLRAKDTGAGVGLCSDLLLRQSLSEDVEGVCLV